MKIKKFIARTFQAGKIQIAAELGEDAVILSTRTSKGPEGDSIIEIVAAIDESKSGSAESSESKRSIKDKIANVESILAGASGGSNTQSLSQKLNSSKAGDSDVDSKPMKAYKELQATEELAQKIESIESSLEQINSSIKYRHTNTLNPILSDLYERLIDGEFEERDILEALAHINLENLSQDPEKAKAAAYRFLLMDLRLGNPLSNNEPSANGSAQIIAFVGTTGNGKTSSVVKIALIAKLLFGSKCMLVSADKNKVGGSDQLRTFSSVADMDFMTAYSKEEVGEVLKRSKEFDFIFFDTSGFSQNDNKGLLFTSDLVKSMMPDRLFLVMSMGLSRKTSEDILDKYSILPITDVVLTKLDEAGRLGGPLTALINSGIPLTYISCGQQIPDDIYPPSRGAFHKLLDLAGKHIRDYESILGGVS